MTPERWARVQELFHAALECPAEVRHTWLVAACAGDAALVAEVEELLAEDATSGSVLDRGLSGAAASLLDDGAALHDLAFGPYRIRSLLGEGGMGVVYLAERDDIGAVAAIKLLRDAWISPARRARFAAEQRTLAQLQHPAIAQLHDAGALADGTPWFVMEYVDGVSLVEWCRARGASLAERLGLFRAVCEAVQYAHRHAIIHRDLKPSNILVTEEGAIKLLDFGIAKQLDDADRPADQTRTGLSLMTPAYAAPEQFHGDRVGIHTDVYSLGVILYELLTERLPYDVSRRTPADAEAVILAAPPPRPSLVDGPLRASIGRALRADLDVLCLTAMHPDPSRRYRTVDALMRDVDHLLADEPLEARPDAWTYRAGKFVRRHAVAVGAGAIVALLLLGVVTFYTIRLREARNAALAEARRAQRVQQFTQRLFQGGDKTAGPSDSLRVIALLDRGVLEARALVDDPATQAELALTLGGIYQQLGRFDRADSLFRAALAARASLPPDPVATADVTLALGLLRVDQAQYEDAERFVGEALQARRGGLAAGDPRIAEAVTALGRVHEERGQYPAAIATLEEAVRLDEAVDTNGAALAEALKELANSHFYVGHYDASDSLNRRALALVVRLRGAKHPEVAEILVNFGANRHERGDYVGAEARYRDALAINRAFYGENHYVTASNLTMLGRSLVYQQRYAEADSLLRRALAIQERVNGPVHPRVASALNDLAMVASKQGRHDEEERNFRRMEAIYRQVYGGKHYLVGIAQSNLASVYLERKQYAEAERRYREVVGLFTETLSAEHLNTGIARLKLGRTLLRERKYPEAEGELLAGYRILGAQASPSVSWLKAARKDLVALYDSMGAPAKGAAYREAGQ